MSTIELKQNLHKLIDSIDDKSFLTRFYELLLNKESVREGLLWKNLTSQQQEELKKIEKKSHDKNNLTSHTKVKAKHSKWL